MSTAIFRAYTSEGFVIAADGLRLRLSDLTIASETVRKIFSIEEPGRSLAYGMAGSIYTGDDSGAIFDFATEAERAAKALRNRRPGDLTRYVELFVRLVNKSYADAKQDGRISEYATCPNVEPSGEGERGNTVANMFFVGYYDGDPAWSNVRFWHDNQRLRSPTGYLKRLRRGQLEISGSAKIANLLFETDDPRFAEFRRPKPPKQEDLTLSEAVEVAKGYIRACSSDAGRQADENCASIGGHLHIATVTPDCGFRWVPGFEPISPS
ncbi:MAG TPA: hypothetical protein VMX16_02035 [Terriglobia bacterium]|nr:hypothetical protein [Terriglobia bacterium]